MLDLVLPPSPVVFLIGHYCIFGLVWRLWMSGRLQDMILERKLFLSILDCEADLGIVRVDDGFSGSSERSTQNNGCPYVSTCF